MWKRAKKKRVLDRANKVTESKDTSAFDSMSLKMRMNICKTAQMGLPPGPNAGAGSPEMPPPGGPEMPPSGGPPTPGLVDAPPLPGDNTPEEKSMVEKLIEHIGKQKGVSYPQKVEMLKKQLGPLATSLKIVEDGVFLNGQLVLEKPRIPDGAVTGNWKKPTPPPPQPGQEGAPGAPGAAPPMPGMPMAAQTKIRDDMPGLIDEQDPKVERPKTSLDAVIKKEIDRVNLTQLPYEQKAQQLETSLGTYLRSKKTPYRIYHQPGQGVVLEMQQVVLPEAQDNQEDTIEEGTGDKMPFKPQSQLENVLTDLTKRSYVTKDMKGKKPSSAPKKHEVPPGPMDREAEECPEPQPYWGKNQETDMSVGDSKVKKSPANKAQPLGDAKAIHEWITKRRKNNQIEVVAEVIDRNTTQE